MSIAKNVIEATMDNNPIENEDAINLLILIQMPIISIIMDYLK